MIFEYKIVFWSGWEHPNGGSLPDQNQEENQQEK